MLKTPLEIGDAIVEGETRRRADLMHALSCVLSKSKGSDVLGTDSVRTSMDGVRRMVARFYGADLARGASAAEISAGVAIAGGRQSRYQDERGVRPLHFRGVTLQPPSATEQRRIVAQWNKGLPDPEVTPIRRVASDGNEVLDRFEMPPGTSYQQHGVHKVSGSGEPSMWTNGGAGLADGSTVQRPRRFVGYIDAVRSFLDKTTSITAVDRSILEYVCEGKTVQWIADEIGVTYQAIQKRICKHRKAAGISGPGKGR